MPTHEERIVALEAANKQLKYSITWLKGELTKANKKIADLDARVKKLEPTPPPVPEFDIAPSGGDDTAALQDKINQLTAQSKPVMRLAPGTYKFSNKLHIWPGTKNFSIVGSNSIFEDISASGTSLFYIGYDVQANNNYNILPSTGVFFSVPVEGLTADLTRATIPAGNIIKPGQWVYIWDEHQHISANDNNNQNATSLFNHGEMAQVKETFGNSVVFTQALGRRYELNPKLVLLQRNNTNSADRDTVTENITIQGIQVESRKKPNANSIFRLGFAVKTNISNCDFNQFNSGAIAVQDSIHTTISNITLNPGAEGVGAGYGIVWGRGSRFTTILKVTAPAGTGFSAVMGHGGGMDCRASEIIAPTGKLDTHGMGEMRAYYSDSKVADLHFGNHMHRNGGTGHKAVNVTCTSSIWVQANCKDIVLELCKGRQLVLNNAYSSGGNPSGGKVESLLCKGCTFEHDNSGGVIYGYAGKVGHVKFQNCTFNNPALYGGILVWRDGLEGTLEFQGCTFNLKTSSFYQAAFEVATLPNKEPGKLIMIGNTVNVDAASDFAVGAWGWQNGTLLVKDNALYTKKANAYFIHAPGSLSADSVIEPNTVLMPS